MKKEPVNRMDLPQGGASQRTGGGAGVTIVTGNGDANTLNGYRTSRDGTHDTIPVLDANGYLPASVLPTSAETATNANGTEMGPRYIGPTAWLVKPLSATDTPSAFVTINGWIGDGNEYAVIQHYSSGIEFVQLAGASTTVKANQFRYSILRGANGSTPKDFPVGAKIVSLGKKARGGYMVENSGSGLYAPYLDTWQNDADADGNVTTDLTTRVGNLAGIGAATTESNASVVAFREQFTGSPNYPVDWNVHGIATENGYFSGHIIAKGGSIVGLLEVTGKLQIGDPDSPASMEMGETVAGWGMSMRDQFGRPFWSLVSAYEAGDVPETVWSVVSLGEQVIHLYRELMHGGDIEGQRSDNWLLDIGPFGIRKKAFTSRAETDDGSGFSSPNMVMTPESNLYKFGQQILQEQDVTLSGRVVLTSGTSKTAELITEDTATLRFGAAAVGFYDRNPIPKPLVDGSTGGNYALQNLCSALEVLGLIENATS